MPRPAAPSTRTAFQMMPEYVGSGLDAKVGGRWKQMGNEEKKAMVDEEMKKMQRLPPNSSYASHRLRVLNKIHQLLSLQVSFIFTLNYVDFLRELLVSILNLWVQFGVYESCVLAVLVYDSNRYVLQSRF